ncbi:MAG: exported protein of unknown function [Candidatus Nitrospira kreftii]|uniref:DUF1311 domain-containing protein n=1 Tax=Candidatus Nitrospira kreftii TaxID=2652173 RepID=A0A7S8IWJ8_9BACT|nr:MAG: exported protein of unknown function [Candidatus Nitrospira kreftii]
MKYMRCVFAAILSAFPILAEAADLELLSASQNPTPQECAAIAGHNSRIEQSLVAQHNRCLGASASASFGEYKLAHPCSKLACREIHLGMHKAHEQIATIARDCQSRIPREVRSSLSGNADRGSAEDVSTQTESKRWAVQIDELLGRTEQAVEIVKSRDRPWSLAELAWGDSVVSIRKRLADRLSGGATKDNLDWDVYDLIFNRAYDAQIANAQAAGNPLARVINEGMLSRLYVTHADIVGQLDRALRDISHVAAQLPALPSTNRHPQRSDTSSSKTRESYRPPDRSQQCAVFQDMEGSSALLDKDPGTWMALNERCNGGR